jgi:hypothetical protein
VFFGGDIGLPEDVMQAGGARAVDPALSETDAGLIKPTALEAIRAKPIPELSFITHDIEGKPRDPDSTSVGCFAVSSKEEAKHRPLKASDVGPDWMK